MCRMVAEVIEGKLKVHSSLVEALSLDRQGRPRIAAVGGGGKTTLLKRLAKEYQASGAKPAVITTTHMKAEDFPGFLIDPSVEEILETRERVGCVFAGARAGEGRSRFFLRLFLSVFLRFLVPY